MYLSLRYGRQQSRKRKRQRSECKLAKDERYQNVIQTSSSDDLMKNVCTLTTRLMIQANKVHKILLHNSCQFTTTQRCQQMKAKCLITNNKTVSSCLSKAKKHMKNQSSLQRHVMQAFRHGNHLPLRSPGNVKHSQLTSFTSGSLIVPPKLTQSRSVEIPGALSPSMKRRQPLVYRIMNRANSSWSVTLQNKVQGQHT